MNGNDFISDQMIPLVAWLMMFVVGMNLSAADFHRLLSYKRIVILATISQFILIPFIALAMIVIFNPPVFISGGMIILAFSSAGAISNLFTHIAKANVALSVTMTAMSNLVALVVMPLFIPIALNMVLSMREPINVPRVTLVLQLILMILLPVIIGMVVRHWLPHFVERSQKLMHRSSLFGLLVLVLLVLVENHSILHDNIWTTIQIATVFSSLTMAAGWGFGWMMGMDHRDRITLLFEFSLRNLAIVAIVGITIFDQSKFLVFPTLFLVAQLPFIILFVVLYNYQTGRSLGELTSLD